jgi:hypothetical protein
MHISITNLCTSLDALATAIRNGWTEDRTLQEVHGWHHPALTRHDLASIPQRLASRIKDAQIEITDSALLTQLSDIPRKLNLLISGVLPQMYNGNGHQAVPAYLGTLEWVTQLVEPYLSWSLASNQKMIPVQMAKKLRGLQNDIDQINVNKEVLASQIALINDATAAAESLPTDLQALKEASEKVDAIYKLSTKSAVKIEENVEMAAFSLSRVLSFDERANKIVEQCEEAYRITTTKGLAGAFDQRAKKLESSLGLWVFGLLGALIMGAVVGAHRIEALSVVLAGTDLQWGVIAIHLVLSLLSVGGPLWFAWLSTKQISQRFRLSEDYAYKASVAKAYEGYRKEAARIDPAFESRLFNSALTRLEEAPLRLVEDQGHSSPLQEIMHSEAFQKLASSIPDFRDRFIDLAKYGIASVSSNKPTAAPAEAEADTPAKVA